MKKNRLFIGALAVAAALMLLPPTDVSAEEPATYSVNYLSDEAGWYYTEGSEFKGGASGVEFLRERLKDGDVVVVYNDSDGGKLLDLGSVRLSNLTIAGGATWAMVQVGSVDNLYALGGSTSSISAPMTNAYIYNDAVCNLNDNVDVLSLCYERDELKPSVNCLGTVGTFYERSINEPDWIYFSAYNFKRRTLEVDKGALRTDEANYSTDLSNAPAPAAAPASTEASAQPASDEYDDVPKTGDSFRYLWLLCASAACFAGSAALRRSFR